MQLKQQRSIEMEANARAEDIIKEAKDEPRKVLKLQSVILEEDMLNIKLNIQSF